MKVCDFLKLTAFLIHNLPRLVLLISYVVEAYKHIHKKIFVNRCLMIPLNTEKKPHCSLLKTSSFKSPRAALSYRLTC